MAETIVSPIVTLGHESQATDFVSYQKTLQPEMIDEEADVSREDMNLYVETAKSRLVSAFEEYQIVFPSTDVFNQLCLVIESILFHFCLNVVEYESKNKDDLKSMYNAPFKPEYDHVSNVVVKYRNKHTEEIQDNNQKLLFNESLANEMSNYLPESDPSISSAPTAAILSLNEQLRKQRDLANLYLFKMKEAGERMRKNEVQMEFMKGQLSRREEDIKEQREALYKEIFLLREQLYHLKGTDADVFSTMSWKQTGDRRDTTSDSLINEKNAKLVKQYSKKIQDMTEKHGEEMRIVKNQMQEKLVKYKDLLKELESQVIDLSEKKVSGDSEREELQSQIVKLTSDLSALSNQKEIYIKRIHEVENANVKLMLENEKKEREKERLRERVVSLARLTGSIEINGKTLSSGEAQELLGNIESVSQTLETKEKEYEENHQRLLMTIEDLRSRLSSAYREMKKHQEDRSKNSTDMLSLRIELENMKEKYLDLENKIVTESMEETIQEMKRSLEEKDVMITDLLAQLEENEKLISKMQELQQDLSNTSPADVLPILQAENRRLILEVHSHKMKLQQQEKKYKEMADLLIKREEKMKELENQVRTNIRASNKTSTIEERDLYFEDSRTYDSSSPMSTPPQSRSNSRTNSRLVTQASSINLPSIKHSESTKTSSVDSDRSSPIDNTDKLTLKPITTDGVQISLNVTDRKETSTEGIVYPVPQRLRQQKDKKQEKRKAILQKQEEKLKQILVDSKILLSDTEMSSPVNSSQSPIYRLENKQGLKSYRRSGETSDVRYGSPLRDSPSTVPDPSELMGLFNRSSDLDSINSLDYPEHMWNDMNKTVRDELEHRDHLVKSKNQMPKRVHETAKVSPLMSVNGTVMNDSEKRRRSNSISNAFIPRLKLQHAQFNPLIRGPKSERASSSTPTRMLRRVESARLRTNRTTPRPDLTPAPPKTKPSLVSNSRSYKQVENNTTKIEPLSTPSPPEEVTPKENPSIDTPPQCEDSTETPITPLTPITPVTSLHPISKIVVRERSESASPGPLESKYHPYTLKISRNPIPNAAQSLLSRSASQPNLIRNRT